MNQNLKYCLIAIVLVGGLIGGIVGYSVYMNQLPICDYCGEGYFGKPTQIRHNGPVYEVCDRCWDYLDNDPQYGARAIWGDEYNMDRGAWIYNQVKRSKSEWNDWGKQNDRKERILYL